MARPAAADQPLPSVLEPTRERVLALPDAVFDCEACASEDSMRIRRSSFNGFGADDVLMKCVSCKHARTHGLGVDDDAFEAERDRRESEYGSRTIDIEKEADETDREVQNLLAALGYR